MEAVSVGLHELYWWQVIAIVLLQAGHPMRNKDIETDLLVKEYRQFKAVKEKMMSNTISDVLTDHAEEGIGNRQHHSEPRIFTKMKSRCGL